MKTNKSSGKERRILVVDDEKLVCWSLNETLTEAGFLVKTALTGAEAKAAFESFRPNIVLLDIRLPDADGIDLLSKFKALDEDVIILMITAYADADSAVNALKAGADDYIGKPFDLDKIRHTVEQCFLKKRLNREVDFFRREQRKKYDYDNLIGNSPQAIEVFKLIKICAETDSKIVLILGKSGTGKELVARAIHYHSARSNEPFIETNCAAIPENLLENELFGHEKGAFTDARQTHKGIFEAANEGTVFLDEIGDMPLIMQTKILKVIESNTFRRLGGKQDLDVDVRIIAATNQNMHELVKQKKFRGDLFYRLNVMTITIPSLKERKEDIPSLANYFIERLNEEYGKNISGIDPLAMKCLTRYAWPGNVRELRNAVERAMMLEEGNLLTYKHFSREISDCAVNLPWDDKAIKACVEAVHRKGYITLPPDGISLNEVEKELIQQALTRFKGNQTKAAKCLHMTRDTLRYRIKKHAITV
ncbi:MAG: response regulator [Desulfobulbaceae bacterium]|nr:response regulator [Desulfobulbaceae bacterium]